MQAELDIGAGVSQLYFNSADGIESGGVVGGELIVGGHVFLG